MEESWSAPGRESDTRPLELTDSIVFPNCPTIVFPGHHIEAVRREDMREGDKPSKYKQTVRFGSQSERRMLGVQEAHDNQGRVPTTLFGFSSTTIDANARLTQIFMRFREMTLQRTRD